jgi:hypothetical protein
MKMALAVVTHDPTSGLPPNPPRPCVVDNPSPTPWPSQLTTEAMAMAGSSISLAVSVRAGTTYRALALVADIEVTSPVILFSVAGLTASSVSVKTVSGPPGQTSSSGIAYVFDLTVAADVPAGDVGVWVGPSSAGASSAPTFAPGLLTVVT